MKLIIKNHELLNIYTALNTLILQKLPISVGWNLGKNSKQIEGLLSELIGAEEALVSEYSIKDWIG